MKREVKVTLTCNLNGVILTSEGLTMHELILLKKVILNNASSLYEQYIRMCMYDDGYHNSDNYISNIIRTTVYKPDAKDDLRRKLLYHMEYKELIIEFYNNKHISFGSNMMYDETLWAYMKYLKNDALSISEIIFKIANGTLKELSTMQVFGIDRDKFLESLQTCSERLNGKRHSVAINTLVDVLDNLEKRVKEYRTNKEQNDFNNQLSDIIKFYENNIESRDVVVITPTGYTITGSTDELDNDVVILKGEHINIGSDKYTEGEANLYLNKMLNKYCPEESMLDRLDYLEEQLREAREEVDKYFKR